MTGHWNGRKVLVTGADGFIGSHLVERLVEEDADVRALVLYNSFNSWGWLDDSAVADAVEVVAGDVRDQRAMDAVAEGRQDIFHLAALIAIPYSYRAVQSFVETNVNGTMNVLNAALRGGAERVIHTSTSEVYGTPDEVPIGESHALKGQSPYAASKIAADKLAESYHASFELPVTVLRPFNTYGPRQSARAVLPTILAQLIAGRKEIRLGSLEPRRDFTYVGDTVDGFLRAAESPTAVGRTVHLGTGRDVSIGELVELALKTVGSDARVVVEEERIRPAASEVQRLLSDPSLARELMGWEPKTGLEDGLRQTAEWIERNLDRFRVDRYNV